MMITTPINNGNCPVCGAEQSLEVHLVREADFVYGSVNCAKCFSWITDLMEEEMGVKHELTSDEGREVLDIVNRYTKTWRLLLQYDEDFLPIPEKKHETKVTLEIEGVRQAIVVLKEELRDRGETTDLFGQERGHGLAGLIGAVFQTFGGEEKAAHLLYFVIKDHPFTDGNKRIGSFLFLLILTRNGLLKERTFGNQALVALALLVAASDPGQKALLIRLVLNLLSTETCAAGAKNAMQEARS